MAVRGTHSGILLRITPPKDYPTNIMAASAAAGGTPADVAPGRAKPAKPEAPNAEDNANLLSFLFFTYMSPFVKLGRTKTLEPEDMPAISHKDRAAPMYDTLSQYWAEEQRRPKPSLLRAMRRLLLSQIVWQFFLQLIFRSLNLVTPVLLEAVILFLQDPTADVSEGWILCAGMFLAPWLGSMCSAHMFHHAVRAWTHARSSVSTIVYRKSLKVRESTKDAEFSTGNIVNIMSSDSDKLGQMLLGYNDAMLVPLQIFVIVVLLEQAVGPAVFAGLAVMLVMLPLMVCVIMKIVAMERIRLGLSDERVKLQSEILQGIRKSGFFRPALLPAADTLCTYRHCQVLRLGALVYVAYLHDARQRVEAVVEAESGALMHYTHVHAPPHLHLAGHLWRVRCAW